MTLVESSIVILHSILHPLVRNKIEYSMYGFSFQSIEVAFIQIIMVRQKVIYRIPSARRIHNLFVSFPDLFRQQSYNLLHLVCSLKLKVELLINLHVLTFFATSYVFIFVLIRKFGKSSSIASSGFTDFNQSLYIKSVPPFLRSEVFHDLLNQQQK